MDQKYNFVGGKWCLFYYIYIASAGSLPQSFENLKRNVAKYYERIILIVKVVSLT